MSNLIIQNEMDSTLDLTAINDVNGNPVSLWPRGDKRASREITEAASKHECVQRVRDAKWVKLIPLATAEQSPDAAPSPTLATTATTEAETPPAIVEEPPVEPAPLADPTPPVESIASEPVPPEPPVSTTPPETRATRRARGA